MTAPDALTSILIVDDTPENLSVLSSILSQRGFKVRPANDGQTALTVAHKVRPDLILLDVRMTGMDGFEVCARLKKAPETCNIPIIFISASDELHDKVRAFEVGGVDYVTKPFQALEVLARVENQLTLYRQRREIERLRENDRRFYEKLSALKDQVMHSTSHDLKNPLSVILGYAHFLENRPSVQNDPQAMIFLTRVKRGAERMLSLVTDLLDIASIETGLSLKPSTVKLAEFLEDGLGQMELLAQEKHIELIYDPPPPDATASFDKERITQVIANLIGNAIKYTPSGGQVRVSASLDNGSCYFRVADTGLGIPSRALPHIFDKFYRVDSKEHLSEDGTGLGLSIVKAIVDQHRGEISVNSEPGKGSIFVVKLPAFA